MGDYRWGRASGDEPPANLQEDVRYLADRERCRAQDEERNRKIANGFGCAVALFMAYCFVRGFVLNNPYAVQNDAPVSSETGQANREPGAVSEADDISDRATNLNEQLCQAAANGSSAKVRQLLKRGADPNAMYAANGFSALHCAIVSGSLSTVKALVKSGADIHARDEATGMTPVEEAANQARFDTKYSAITDYLRRCDRQ